MPVLRQGHERAVLALLVLVEDEVPDLQEPRVALVAAGAVLRVLERVAVAVLLAVVVVDLRARAAGAGVARRSPPVLALGEAEDLVLRHADGHPELLGLDVLRRVLVALEDRDPEPLGGEAELHGQELPGPLDGLLLEVVAEGEVAEHLEEGEVARVADLLYVLACGSTSGRSRPRGRAACPRP